MAVLIDGTLTARSIAIRAEARAFRATTALKDLTREVRRLKRIVKRFARADPKLADALLASSGEEDADDEDSSPEEPEI